jgi:uncharacterized iron-regulated protein
MCAPLLRNPTMRSLALLVVVVAVCGCASAMHTPPSALEGARIVRAASGEELTFEAFIDELLDARAIYVGERHDSPADHRAQLAIVAALHARDPALAIGLEMFDARAQDALDAYVTSAIDEATFLEQSDYAERWGFDYAQLRPVMEWAREHRVRVVALNVPREVTQAVARHGIAGLTSEQRASIPAEITLSHAEHRAMVEAALEGHPGMTDEQRQRFYEAQVVWDESMGAAVARALEAAPSLHRIVVFAGAFHVSRGLGIPRTAALRGAAPHAVVLPLAPEEAEERLAASPEERGDDLLLVHSP